MPWKASHATRHTRKATTQRLRDAWRKAANNALKYYGDEGAAVRVANAVVNRMSGGTGRGPVKSRRTAKAPARGRRVVRKSASTQRARRTTRRTNKSGMAGRRHSTATRKKMSKSHKARWKKHGARYRRNRKSSRR